MIINLITDLGTTDHYLSKLKLSILREVPSATFIDTAHDIAPYDISLAAFHLSSLISSSPARTLHIVAVNSHYADDSRHLIFEKEGQYFVGPDNGIFFLTFPDLLDSVIYRLDNLDKRQSSYYATYAQAARSIANERTLAETYDIILDPVEKITIRPGVSSNYIRATVEQVDHYGNVITNITKALFEREVEGKRYEIHYHPGPPITRIAQNYGEVGVDEVVCLWNENNRMEIAVNMGHASSLLNLHRGDSIQIDLI